MDCRFCQHYQFEGKRGGTCTLFGGGVNGRKATCGFGVHPFTKPIEVTAAQTEPDITDLPPGFKRYPSQTTMPIAAQRDPHPPAQPVPTFCVLY